MSMCVYIVKKAFNVMKHAVQVAGMCGELCVARSCCKRIIAFIIEKFCVEIRIFQRTCTSTHSTHSDTHTATHIIANMHKLGN